MKQPRNLGKNLNRNEMKAIVGGMPGPCYGNNLNCPSACQADPNLIKGYTCVGNTCIYGYCP